MVPISTRLGCPFCGSSTKSDGSPFTSDLSLSLHVAGKARTAVDKHTSWVTQHVPEGINLNKLSINQIEELIRFDFDRLLETFSSGTTAPTLSNEASPPLGIPSKSASVPDAYLKAYRMVWEIETELHQFVFDSLKKQMGTTAKLSGKMYQPQ